MKKKEYDSLQYGDTVVPSRYSYCGVLCRVVESDKIGSLRLRPINQLTFGPGRYKDESSGWFYYKFVIRGRPVRHKTTDYEDCERMQHLIDSVSTECIQAEVKRLETRWLTLRSDINNSDDPEERAIKIRTDNRVSSRILLFNAILEYRAKNTD